MKNISTKMIAARLIQQGKNAQTVYGDEIDEAYLELRGESGNPVKLHETRPFTLGSDRQYKVTLEMVGK